MVEGGLRGIYVTDPVKSHFISFTAEDEGSLSRSRCPGRPPGPLRGESVRAEGARETTKIEGLPRTLSFVGSQGEWVGSHVLSSGPGVGNRRSFAPTDRHLRVRPRLNPHRVRPEDPRPKTRGGVRGVGVGGRVGPEPGHPAGQGRNGRVGRDQCSTPCRHISLHLT